MKKSYIYFAIIALVLTAIILVAKVSKANTSRTAEGCKTATATSTVRYMRPGVATTTITCNIATLGLGVDSLDTAKLEMFFHSSSTATTLNWMYEYSTDGVDWYRDNISQVSTSTKVFANGAIYSWTFASSTKDSTGVLLATSTKMVDLPTPTRWVRVIFTLPIGSLNGGIWAGVVGKAEQLN